MKRRQSDYEKEDALFEKYLAEAPRGITKKNNIGTSVRAVNNGVEMRSARSADIIGLVANMGIDNNSQHEAKPINQKLPEPKAPVDVRAIIENTNKNPPLQVVPPSNSAQWRITRENITRAPGMPPHNPPSQGPIRNKNFRYINRTNHGGGILRPAVNSKQGTRSPMNIHGPHYTRNMMPQQITPNNNVIIELSLNYIHLCSILNNFHCRKMIAD